MAWGWGERGEVPPGPQVGVSTRRPTQITVHFTEEVWNKIIATAVTMDLSNSSLVGALVDGAFRLGQVDRLTAAAKSPVKRRGYKSHWQSTGRYGWMRGEYTLTRSGAPNGYMKPGDGWYLDGPGVGEPKFVGTLWREARLTADSIIERIENP